MAKTVLISLGFDDLSKNKIILGGKEIDLSEVSYFLFEANGCDRNWIIGTKKPTSDEESDIDLRFTKELSD